MVVILNQTSDQEGDIARLHSVVTALKEFPGQDEVSLRVTNNGNAINLRLPNVQAGYCPELRQRLVALVGEEGLSVEASESVSPGG